MTNKTIKTTRDFKYLIITFINIIILFLGTLYYKYIKNLKYPFTGQEKYNDEKVTEFFKYQDSQQEIYSNILLASILISIFITLYEFNTIRKSSIKWLFIIWGIYIISALITFGSHSHGASLIYRDNNDYLWSYFLFFPHIVFTIKNSILGSKVDITNEIEQKEDSVKNNKISDLDYLFKSGILNEIEFNEKKEKVIKEKIKIDIQKTKEYNLLLKTKNAGLLSEKEFENKIEELINKIYLEKV